MGSEERTLTIQSVQRADAYEVVHFIGHTLFNPDLKASDLKVYAGKIEDEIAEKTGYAAFVRGIKIKHYPPFMTDVDFIIDSPATSPIAGATIILIITAIKTALPVILALLGLAVVAFLWWDSWVEKSKIYICEQDPTPLRFEGYASYLGHLRDMHPVKYQGILDASSSNWWEKAIRGIGGLLGLGIVIIALSKPKERRR